MLLQARYSNSQLIGELLVEHNTTRHNLRLFRIHRTNSWCNSDLTLISTTFLCQMFSLFIVDQTMI